MNERPAEIVRGIYMLKVPLIISFAERDDSSTTLCYLVETHDGWLMVDSGYNDKGAFNRLCQQLDSLGIPLHDIRWLFLTHYHPDHSGLAQRIKEASGAQVIIHEIDWNILQGTVSSSDIWNLDGLVEWARSLGIPSTELQNFYDTASFGRQLFPRGLQPDVVLHGEENTVAGEEHLRAILTPGHSPGHICLYDERKRVLFSGDHVLVEITPHISPSHLTSYNQLGQYLEALQKVRPLDADLVLPAHQRPFDYLARRVDEILDHHQERLAEVMAGLADHPSTPWDLASTVHWDVGSWDEMVPSNRVLAARETLAHLEFLESRGQVAVDTAGGIGLYSLVDQP